MGMRVRGQKSPISSNTPRGRVTCQSQPYTHAEALPFKLSAGQPHQPSWVYTLLSILPKFVPQTLVLPTGKELCPNATRV